MPSGSSELCPVHVEVRRRPDNKGLESHGLDDCAVQRLVEDEVKRLPLLQDGLFTEFNDLRLKNIVYSVRISGISESRHVIDNEWHPPRRSPKLPFWKASLKLYVYTCAEDVSMKSETNQGTTGLPSKEGFSRGVHEDSGSESAYKVKQESFFEEENAEEPSQLMRTQSLPSEKLEGSWEALILEPQVDTNLLNYIASACLFSSKGVDTKLISVNRMVLLHGPPGTGKTTLCRALSHKVSIRLRCRAAKLFEVHTSSLFSKWFSESAKNVRVLFSQIRREAQLNDFVVVLVDEVESISAGRVSAASGSDPGDSMRVVNTLLTEIDSLQEMPNILIVATSNLSGQIDPAFLDRADIRQYIGPPNEQARYEILLSGVKELLTRGILSRETSEVIGKNTSIANQSAHASTKPGDGSALLGIQDVSLRDNDMLAEIDEEVKSIIQQGARLSKGASGRSLRKVCFLAHANLNSRTSQDISVERFLERVLDVCKGLATEVEARDSK